MARLIDADEFIREVDEEADTRLLGYDGGVNLSDVKEWIDAQPTVDAVEVVHGEWIVCEEDLNGEVTYKCSNCGDELVTLCGFEIDWNYCPECGAKMDGGDKE